MPQGIDDFTIVLPELTEMTACELKVYHGLERLWRMIEKYKMTAPIAIRVVDNKAKCIRVLRGNRRQAASWQLEDESTAVELPPGGEVEFPLSINVQDAKGNILKMRAQVGVPKPELLSNPCSRLIKRPSGCKCPRNRPTFDCITSKSDFRPTEWLLTGEE